MATTSTPSTTTVEERTVVVNGAEHLNDNEISALFYRFSKVSGVKRVDDGTSGVQIELETEAQAQEAVKTLDDSFIEHDRKITVRLLSELLRAASAASNPSSGAVRSGGKKSIVVVDRIKIFFRVSKKKAM